VVGNSTPIKRGFTTGNASSVLHDTGYDFTGAQTGDQFFAAAYSSDNFSDDLATDAYLQNSANGTTTPDLTILNFTWAAPVIIVPTDTTPPNVTIVSPVNGHFYFKNDTVLASSTVTDLSPIASVVYKFNGAVVAGGSALPLSSAPAGTSTATLVVAATDSFGNMGYATSTFTIAPADTNAPSITITSPLNNGLYAKTDTAFLSATITDQSPIAAPCIGSMA